MLPSRTAGPSPPRKATPPAAAPPHPESTDRSFSPRTTGRPAPSRPLAPLESPPPAPPQSTPARPPEPAACAPRWFRKSSGSPATAWENSSAPAERPSSASRSHFSDQCLYLLEGGSLSRPAPPRQDRSLVWPRLRRAGQRSSCLLRQLELHPPLAVQPQAEIPIHRVELRLLLLVLERDVMQRPSLHPVRRRRANGVVLERN